LSACHEGAVPPKKAAPANVLPPSFGIMLTRTPPAETSAPRRYQTSGARHTQFVAVNGGKWRGSGRVNS
jgi:hypothetical protein